MHLYIENVKMFGRTLSLRVGAEETREDAIAHRLKRDGFKKVYFLNADKRAKEGLDVPESGEVFATGTNGPMSFHYSPNTKTANA